MNPDRGDLTATEAAERLAVNRWDNVYWFARMLIASDEYGAVGTDSKTMAELADGVRSALRKLERASEYDSLDVLQATVDSIITSRWKDTKKAPAVRHLISDLSRRLLTKKDFEVLMLTCERILVPTNAALKRIPSDDREFAEGTALELLKKRGEQGLATVINLWDEVGSHGCMSAERVQVVEAFARTREWVNTCNLSPEEKDTVLTAFCQEFERRVGQKRKGRAGRGVESVTSFILNYYGIKASSEPEHFTTGLEIDRWVRTKGNWYIGISCKRTLRERWKQAYTTDLDLLNRHRIKALWHVVTFDHDLSDDKLTEMGSHRAVFFLPDDSPRYISASKHTGMSGYVRPITSFFCEHAQV